MRNLDDYLYARAPRCVEFLLKAGAKANNTQDKYGMTALMIASLNGRHDVR